MISGILNKTQKNAVSESEEQDTTFLSSVVPAETELDLARSAWFDHVFAVWFAPFAKSQVLFHGTRGEAFFKECGEFYRSTRSLWGLPATMPRSLTDKGALDWFKSMSFPELLTAQRTNLRLGRWRRQDGISKADTTSFFHNVWKTRNVFGKRGTAFVWT